MKHHLSQRIAQNTQKLGQIPSSLTHSTSDPSYPASKPPISQPKTPRPSTQASSTPLSPATFSTPAPTASQARISNLQSLKPPPANQSISSPNLKSPINGTVRIWEFYQSVCYLEEKKRTFLAKFLQPNEKTDVKFQKPPTPKRRKSNWKTKKPTHTQSKDWF